MKSHKRGKRGCSKLSFPSREAARRTIEIAEQQRGEAPKKLRVYLCNKCGQFHLTTQP